MANAIARGRATIPTVIPAEMSLVRLPVEYPRNSDRTMGRKPVIGNRLKKDGFELICLFSFLKGNSAGPEALSFFSVSVLLETVKLRQGTADVLLEMLCNPGKKRSTPA